MPSVDRRLGGGTRNLNLYGRRLDVLESDVAYADAQRLLRTQLDELRELYLRRLRSRARRCRGHPPPVCGVGSAAQGPSSMPRSMRCGRSTSHRQPQSPRHTSASTSSTRRMSVRASRGTVTRLPRSWPTARAIAIAGGHVGVLNDCLHLCNLAVLIEERPLLAWSSGCMAVSERIVVVDDDDPAGRPDEVYDIGIGVARGMVALPVVGVTPPCARPGASCASSPGVARRASVCSSTPVIASSCAPGLPADLGASESSTATVACFGARTPPDRDHRLRPQPAGTRPPAQRGQHPRGD